MKVLHIANIPSPYRVDYFNKLGKLCDLTVVFERADSSERDKSWKKNEFINFKGVICKGKKIGVDAALSVEPIKYINRNRDGWIIIGNALSFTGALEILYMKRKKIAYWIEGDGAFPGNEKVGGIKYRVKKYLISGADGYLSTCLNHDKYYIKYGADKNKIFRYPFTSISEENIIKKVMSNEDKMIIREKLGMKEEHIIISVGQYIYRKGFDILIEASKRLGKEIGVYIIGGKDYRIMVNEPQIHEVPFKVTTELVEYYRAADIFVLPTREDIWGLVINEAMANGLPVLTTNRCNAGLQLIKNGENGYIVPVDNVEAMVDRIKRLLFSDNLEKMGNESLKTIREYTIEKMAQSHIDIYESRQNVVVNG